MTMDVKDKQYLDREYSQQELDNAEKALLKIMSSVEKKEYSGLTSDEKLFFLSGFLDNINDYKKAAEDNNEGGTPPPGGMPQPKDPKQHLPKWMNPKKQKPNNKNSQQQGRKGIPITDDIENTEKQIDDAQSAADNLKNAANDLNDAISDLINSTNGEAPEKAQKVKDALAKVREAAADMADATTELSDGADDLVNKMRDAVKGIKDLENKGATPKNNKNNSGNGSQPDSAGEGSGEAGKNGSSSGMAGTDGAEANNDENSSSSGMSDNNGSQTGADGNDSQSGMSGSSDQNGMSSGSSSQGSKYVSTSARAEAKLDKARQKNNEMADDMRDANTTSNDVSRDAAKANKSIDKINDDNVQPTDTNAAIDNATKAAEDALKAAEAAQAAIDKAKIIEKNAKDIEDMRKSLAGDDEHTSVFDEPILFQPPKVNKEGKQVAAARECDGPDLSKQKGDIISTEDAKRLAEEAGYEYDAAVTPEQLATSKFTHIQQHIEDIPGEHGQGYGNSPVEIIDYIGNLYPTPTIDWRSRVKKFFREKSAKDIIMRRTTGLVGLHSAGNEAGRGAYLPTHEHPEEKVTGLTQVLFMVDTSGSMQRVAGDGQNIFLHIMGELIELEKKTYIKNSAYACFNGNIDRNRIIKWTHKEAKDSTLKKIFAVPASSGGTDIISSIKEIMRFPDIYNLKKKPYTLLVIITDGEDNYSNIKSIMSEDMLKNAIIMITQQTDALVKKYTDNAITGGFDEKNVIGINYVAEWGEDITTNRKNNR